MAYDNLGKVPTQTRRPVLATGTPALQGRSATGSTSTLGSINSAVDSPLGQLAIGGLGAYLTNRQQQGNFQQQQAMAEQQLAQQQALAMSNLLGDQIADDRGRATSAARPIGESTDYASRRALIAALLPQLSGHNYSPGDPAVASAMGAQAPTLDMAALMRSPQVAQAFSPQATASAIGQRDLDIANINPHSSSSNLGALGLSQFGDQGVEAGRQNALGRLQESQAQQRQALLQAIDMGAQSRTPAAPPEGYEYDKKTGELKKKGSKLKTFAKIAGIAGAGLATALTAGAASPALAAAIGAGSGALSGALNGGGVKGALLGAGLGAATGGLGGGAAGGATSGIKAGLTTTLRDPKFWINQAPGIAGAVRG